MASKGWKQVRAVIDRQGVVGIENATETERHWRVTAGFHCQDDSPHMNTCMHACMKRCRQAGRRARAHTTHTTQQATQCIRTSTYPHTHTHTPTPIHPHLTSLGKCRATSWAAKRGCQTAHPSPQRVPEFFGGPRGHSPRGLVHVDNCPTGRYPPLSNDH